MSTLENRLETMITGMCAGRREDELISMITVMCAGMREHELKAVILAAIPDQQKWCLSYESSARLEIANGDEKVFGNRNSGHIDVLDQIRLAVSSEDSGNIGRGDEAVADQTRGPIFYELLLILYAKWRDLHGSGADDTDSTSGSESSGRDFEMGVTPGILDVHAKLQALYKVMHE